ncbi:hypothetical protein [Clostridium sp. KNHs205]|jgi:hypothetical protein|uniref:hypothetical protein n=1 Tax=Clostridium sp. KNHs205 TaxID=1449050 RepID=UPI00051B5E52|nr:hypothetical protein [Clostridium sp. KNHs205]
MEYLYRNLSIYADPNDNLIIFPTGESPKREGATVILNLPIQLLYPYTDEELEKSIYKAMDLCFSIIPDDEDKTTPIEKFLNIKGYSRAVKERRLIFFFWNVDEGYIITPSQKIPRQGYSSIDEKEFRLGMNPKEEEIAKAIREAMKLSTP